MLQARSVLKQMQDLYQCTAILLRALNSVAMHLAEG